VVYPIPELSVPVISLSRTLNVHYELCSSHNDYLSAEIRNVRRRIPCFREPGAHDKFGDELWLSITNIEVESMITERDYDYEVCGGCGGRS
jgi:hypothetical protein